MVLGVAGKIVEIVFSFIGPVLSADVLSCIVLMKLDFFFKWGHSSSISSINRCNNDAYYCPVIAFLISCTPQENEAIYLLADVI